VKQGLSLGFSQSLSLTPQLQHSIRLLQLSSLELEQEIEQQLASNPFLERDNELSERERFDSLDAPSPLSELGREQASLADDASHAVTHDTTGGDMSSSGDDRLDGFDGEMSNWDGDGSIEMAPNDTEWGTDAQGAASASTSSSAPHDADFDPLGGLSRATNLQDHLKRQAQHLRLTPTDAASLAFLIESLDERGFLTEPLDELAASLSSDENDIERLVDQLRIARQWLLNLEPCGVGAKDVSECLRLQLVSRQSSLSTQLDAEVFQTAMQLVLLPLEVLAKQQTKRLAQTCNCPESLIQSALQAIRACEPVPARRFAPLHNSVIVPDVFVRPRNNATFDVQLNQDLMPRLKVDEITARLLKLHKQRERAKAGKKDPQAALAAEAMQQSLLEARGFIKAIAQRFDTVLRVATAIVARQGQFLMHGAVAMRPLVLRDIADELGLHESTVSRVTTSKYMHTPQGTFEFKYFFDASLGTDSGGETSGTAVRALIAQLIGAENKAKPLSDGKLANLLEAQGIECARRTVAKYREAMRIPVASLRRQ
jgi:RNA polymerase sigma-54 factor